MTKLEIAAKAYSEALATYRKDAAAMRAMEQSRDDYESRIRELERVKRASNERLYDAREALDKAAEEANR